MKDYIYTSNTLGASANQLFFESNVLEIHKGRVFYKITHGGKYSYSLLFTNIIDTTYADGSKSRKNRIMPEWQIHKASFARYAGNCFENGIDIIPEDKEFTDITFCGKTTKSVSAGEIFKSDEFVFEAEAGEYICIQLEFSGSELPYHEESLLPIYRQYGGKWIYDRKMPLPACIGCNLTANARIGFWGDSITQGIGTAHNSYLHWNSLIAEKLGSDYSYWNLGVGYARADDAASEGIWFEKALMNDIIFVCMGVNDILQGYSADEIKNSLLKIVTVLKSKEKKVILQTLPPFDYSGDKIVIWSEVNDFILSELKCRVDFVFDCVNVLGCALAPHTARFGGHPNEEGCAVWADALYKSIKEANILP